MVNDAHGPAGVTPVPPPPSSGGPPLGPTRALAAGWQAFLAQPWLSLGVLVVLFAVQTVGTMIPYLGFLFAFLVSPALYAGGAWFFLRGIRNENPPFENAFEGFQRWPSATGAVLVVVLVSMLIMVPLFAVIAFTVGLSFFTAQGQSNTAAWAVLAGAPILATLLVTCVVAAWWSARTWPVYFVVMEADRPAAFDALRRSFALTKGSVWRAIGLYLLWIPVSLLGLLALCVGVLPACVVICYSAAHAYEQLRARAR